MKFSLHGLLATGSLTLVLGMLGATAQAQFSPGPSGFGGTAPLPGQPLPAQPGNFPAPPTAPGGTAADPQRPGSFSPPGPREASLMGNSISGIKAAIKCLHDIKLAAQADGILQELLVDEGAAVEKGQVVLTIDERTARAELAVAEKEMEAAEAQASQDANLRFSKKVAEVSDAEYLEIKELYDRNSASKQETRRKLLEAEKARLGIEVAQVDHSKDILAAAVSKEKVSAAKVQLTLRQVTSPYDGIIEKRLRDQGEWVKAGEPILSLMHMKEMRIEANVPVRGSDVAKLQNADITIRVPIGGQEWTHTTKVEFVSPKIEMSTCRIWARIPNSVVGSSWLLRDGMDAVVDIKFSPVDVAQASAR
ncbi:MAG: HlyD family efflux transporter periplasmic adaptor subunit [Pirellulaceae bacterium]|nr:HlyD family efflux transporter periplasmic adaptor subunit [Pirellulaceae bacterium]